MGTVVSLYGIQPIRVGGVECFCRELSLQLAEHGWRSIVVFSAEPIAKVAEYLRLPNLTIEVVPHLEDSRLHSVPAVSRILAKHKPTIVHLNFLGFLGPYPWLAKLHGAREIFITDHGSRPGGYTPRRAPAWKCAVARLINEPVNGVFGVSEYNRRTLLALGYVDQPLCHLLYESIYVPSLHNAKTLGAEFRRRYSIPDDRELVMQVSWVIPEKGVPDFLEAARLVSRERPKTHFAVVGNGRFLEPYRRESVQMGLGGCLTWTGLIENPMEEGVYAAADVFCLASRWNEAFGWVIAEAMSFETPVVATSMGGIPEIVDEGVTGHLVPPSNPVELAEKILRLLNDTAARERMGKAARKAVAERFELRSTVRGLLEHYGVKRGQLA